MVPELTTSEKSSATSVWYICGFVSNAVCHSVAKFSSDGLIRSGRCLESLVSRGQKMSVGGLHFSISASISFKVASDVASAVVGFMNGASFALNMFSFVSMLYIGQVSAAAPASRHIAAMH